MENGLSVNEASFGIKVSKNFVIEYVNQMDDLKKKIKILILKILHFRKSFQ